MTILGQSQRKWVWENSYIVIKEICKLNTLLSDTGQRRKDPLFWWVVNHINCSKQSSCINVAEKVRVWCDDEKLPPPHHEMSRAHHSYYYYYITVGKLKYSSTENCSFTQQKWQSGGYKVFRETGPLGTHIFRNWIMSQINILHQGLEKRTFATTSIFGGVISMLRVIETKTKLERWLKGGVPKHVTQVKRL